MKSLDTNKSSDELQKEVRRELRNVERDLDKIEARLTPGRIIDDTVFRGRSVGETLDHLKRNPVGTTFLSLGTIMLMEDDRKQTYEHAARERVSSLRETIRSRHEEVSSDSSGGKIDSIKETVREKVGDIKNKLSSKKDEISYKAGSTSENFKTTAMDVRSDLEGKAEDVKNRVQSKFDDYKTSSSSDSDYENWTSSESAGMKQKVKDSLSSAKGKVSSNMDTARDKLNMGVGAARDKLHSMDSMSYMALGAGLGALTGASLPISDKEREFVDQNLSDHLSGLDGELREAINECSNILKDLVISDVKDFSMKVL